MNPLNKNWFKKIQEITIDYVIDLYDNLWQLLWF